MEMLKKLKYAYLNRPTKTFKERLYIAFSISIVVLISVFFIVKDMSVKKSVMASLDKAQIKYSGVSCGGVIWTDCVIDNPELQNSLFAREVRINNIFELSGYSTPDGADVDIEVTGLALGDRFKQLFASTAITNNVGPDNIVKAFNGGDLFINGKISGDGTTLSSVNHLKISSTNGLLPFSIVFNVDDLNTSEAVFNSADFSFETKGIKTLFYNIYLGYGKKSNFTETNKNLLGINKSDKLSAADFNKALFIGLHEERKAEFDFYRNKSGGNALYYQNFEKFLLNKADLFTVSISNPSRKNINEIMFIKSSGASLEEVFDINITSAQETKSFFGWDLF